MAVKTTLKNSVLFLSEVLKGRYVIDGGILPLFIFISA